MRTWPRRRRPLRRSSPPGRPSLSVRQSGSWMRPHPGSKRRWRSKAGRSPRCPRIRTAAKGSRRSSKSVRRNIREFRRQRRGTEMTDALIFDHVRTPRGRGRPDGSLHRITPIELAAQSLRALRDRNALDTSAVDDVVLGCVTPIGEQGADIARVAALVAGFAETVPGKQLNRFCASGLEAVNTAAAQVMSGQSDVAIGGGVESMSRVPMGTDGGAWAIDPQVAWHQYFVPQGISADLIATLDGYSRVAVHGFAAVTVKRGDQVRADALRDEVVVPGALRVDRPGPAIRTHRDARHRFDTAADRDVRLARHHLRGGGVDRLEPGGAEAVQLLAGDGLSEPGDERRDARDVRALLADRRHAAEHDVVDDAGVERAAVAQRPQRLRRELDRGDAMQRAVGAAAAARRSDMVEDECVGHFGSPALPAKLTDISPDAFR